jgi:hypothetical protein
MARETQGRPAGEKKLEQYGVWVKVKPKEVSTSAVPEEVGELSDLESVAPARIPSGRTTLTAEEENLLDELDSEMAPRSETTVSEEEPVLADAELPDIESASPAPAAEEALDLTVEELPELDEEPLAPAKTGIRKPLPAASESEIEVTLSEEKEDHFDDLAALETELASVGATAQAASGSSAQILARIEEELRSIRTDLTQLRTELSGLRSRAGAEPAAETARAEAGGGFFDEDEDETIALTGDELDNILNTADITEEAAEASTAELEEASPALAAEAGPEEDILSLETPEVSAGRAAEPAEEAAEVPVAEAEPVAMEETLVLAEEPGLPGEEEGSAELEELPSELVLEDLGAEKPAAGARGEVELTELPSDIEALPLEPEALAAAPAEEEAGSETIDLETLDMGEEPRVIDAVAEQAEDLESVAEAEPVLEEEPAAPAVAPSAEDVLSDDVDLEALAAEAAELEDEPLAKTAAPSAAPVEAAELAGGIEIPFEAEVAKPSPEADAELEQIIEAEEVGEEAPPAAGRKPATPSAAPAPAGTSDIPDNLKDEIRTVLKYMDHLLEALPDDKIQEFASSEYFVMYKKLFEDLGLGE